MRQAKITCPAATGPSPTLVNFAVTLIFLLFCMAPALKAQELQPRAYFPAPVGVTFFGTTYSHNTGGLLLDPSLPIEDSNVTANITTLSVGQTLGFLGRSVQLLAVLPYVEAHLTGKYQGTAGERYRSGLGDSVFRYAMNIYGAPAMRLPQFARYREKLIIGASITMSAPTGQYDPNVLINIGTNRWAFKPEIGLSRALGKWVLEADVGAWLYTENKDFFGGSVSAQSPLYSAQAHVVRDMPWRTWVAFDTTYFTGGKTRINDGEEKNSFGNLRMGVTWSIPIGARQNIKISYFAGTVTRLGSDIRSFGIAYNIIGIRPPR
jgi:hypothetical protein